MIKELFLSLSVVNKLLTFLNRKTNRDNRKLKEDKKLVDAIKKGDGKTVSKIRKRKKDYPNLYILFFFIMFAIGCSGCKTLTYKDIPLTSGEEPYQLPVGVYVDTQGVEHNETNMRWSVSEEFLYNKIKDEEKEAESRNSLNLESITGLFKNGGMFAVLIATLFGGLYYLREKMNTGD